MYQDLISSFQLASVASSFSNIGIAFQNITFREVIDIALVALAIYIVLLFVKQTRSYFVAGVSLVLMAVSFLSQNLNLSLTRSILQPLSTLTFIIIAIVFQREIRKFFKWIVTGQRDLFSSAKQISKGTSGEIADALLYMAEKRIGGIIVFPGKQELDDLIEGGQRLGGEVTKEIILSIFDTNSSGHDGAIVIEHDAIKLFGVHLPLAREYTGYRKAGTRHRASAGVTEDTDAIAIAVSEERGTITAYEQGKGTVMKEDALRELLKKLTGEEEKAHTSFWHYFFLSNLGTKALALSVASILWIFLFVQTGVIKKEYTVPLSFQLLPSGLEIESKTSTRQVNVVLQGKSRDISLIDATKLEIRVDAKDFASGTKAIEIKKEMLNVPSYITVSEIEPESIDIIIKNMQSAPPSGAETGEAAE